jgi:carbon monoxide dehydrogenase subunit G
MKFDGEITVPARRDAVFDAVRDARFFASCIEGVSDLEEIDPTHYSAVMATRIAYMRFKFKVAVEVLRIESPNLIEAKVEGTPLGIVGRLSATSVTTLEEVGSDTRIRYEIDVSLAGKLGSLGQPAFKAKAKEMEKQFSENLRKAFESAPGATAASGDGASAGAVP